MSSFKQAGKYIGAAGIFARIIGFFALSATLGAPAQTPFHPNPHLYSETANPAADIAMAEAVARREGKHILLEFGGNWCGDCQVLDFYYHQPPNVALLTHDYVVVHVDIGHIDRNLDIAKRYNTPVDHGVPSLAVLDARGKLLYAEQPKEFEHTSPEALFAMLNRWKPGGPK